MTMEKPRIHRRGDPAVCMVVGCEKKALYRSGYHNTGARRGYCREHKSSANITARSRESHVEWGGRVFNE